MPGNTTRLPMPGSIGHHAACPLVPRPRKSNLTASFPVSQGPSLPTISWAAELPIRSHAMAFVPPSTRCCSPPQFPRGQANVCWRAGQEQGRQCCASPLVSGTSSGSASTGSPRCYNSRVQMLWRTPDLGCCSSPATSPRPRLAVPSTTHLPTRLIMQPAVRPPPLRYVKARNGLCQDSYPCGWQPCPTRCAIAAR